MQSYDLFSDIPFSIIYTELEIDLQMNQFLVL